MKLMDIVCSGNLPERIYNKETEEMETIHMIQVENTFYVSKEVFSVLKEEFGENND